MSAFIDLNFLYRSIVNLLPIKGAPSDCDIELVDMLSGSLEDRAESAAFRAISNDRACAGDHPSFTIRPSFDGSNCSFELFQNKLIGEEGKMDEVLAFRTISLDD